MPTGTMIISTCWHRPERPTGRGYCRETARRGKKDLLGLCTDEHLTIEQQHREEYQGIRPAIGYPSLPDTSANFLIDQLLDMKLVGIRLTESG